MTTLYWILGTIGYLIAGLINGAIWARLEKPDPNNDNDNEAAVIFIIFWPLWAVIDLCLLIFWPLSIFLDKYQGWLVRLLNWIGRVK